MGITVQWDDAAQTTLSIAFIGEWTSSDFRAAHELMANMMLLHTERVDTVYDFRRSEAMRPDYPLMTFLRQRGAQHDGLILVVGGGSLLEKLIGVMRETYTELADRLLLVETADEARELIKLHRRWASSPRLSRLTTSITSTTTAT